MTRTAFYPGSFDPLTNGHLDILMQALHCVDKVVVGIGIHPGKAPMFSFDERANLIRQVVGEVDESLQQCLEVKAFDGLAVDAARDCAASMMVRGLRDGTDLDYEMQLSGMNGTMQPDIKTVFFPATPATRFITGTLVRQIAKMGGEVEKFVPAPVLTALHEKLQKAG